MQITGKAMMLDEIINYVQSLQRQVEVSVIELLSESLVKSQDFSSATTEPVCPCLLWIFQFLSMKLSAISPELNRDLDLRDVRLQFEKSNCGAKNAFQFTVPIAHIDLPFINACHCRSFAHKMLMLHFRDTVHNLAACILTCSGHLSKVSRVQNHTG